MYRDVLRLELDEIAWSRLIGCVRLEVRVKRILYISNYKKGLGGINAQVDLLCECINGERIRGLEDERRGEKICADIFPTKGNSLKRIGLFIKLLFVARRYDVLHIHGCSDWGMLPVVYGVIAGKIWRKRIIVTYHGGGAGDFFERHGVFASRWLRRADKVIVLSGFLKKVFDKYEIPCLVIPNIVTLREDIYQPKESIAPKMISIRHLTELYRIDMIIRAFAQVLEKYPEATLDILGQGDQREALEQYVREHHLSGVHFIGQVPNEQIYDYLKANDIMLSAPKIDNMPVSLLEAMNAGVLVISSNVGGVPYMIEHGRTGLLSDSSQDSDVSDQMAEQILWALEHQEESVRMIEAAHEEIKKYSWTEVRKQLLPLYECI